MNQFVPVDAEIDDISEKLRLLGLKVEVAELADSTKGLQAVTSGIPFSAFLFKNEEQRSPYLMLSAMFPDQRKDSEWANQWNNRFPLTRASVASNGEPMLTHSIILTGISAEHLKEVVTWWDVLLRVFVEEILSGASSA
jgi:Putative bacterial sensory transduction regulator